MRLKQSVKVNETERQSKRLQYVSTLFSRPMPASYGLICNDFATFCPARVTSSINAKGMRAVCKCI